jgi:hypothetical protein
MRRSRRHHDIPVDFCESRTRPVERLDIASKLERSQRRDLLRHAGYNFR